MEFPKLNYDDFYKFIMSAGILSSLIGVGILTYLFLNNSELYTNFYFWPIFVAYTFIVMLGIFAIAYSVKKWSFNQNLHDRKLVAETTISEQTAQKMLNSEDKIYPSEIQQSKNSKPTALVSYKIASVLPNTIAFDFLRDWKVWFWIANHEQAKYRAYVKIKFISDNFEKEIPEGYYGGTKAWNLNAFSGVQAPGLDIPVEIREMAKQNKRIEIRIYCEIKDENDKSIENKLPQGYVYDYKNNNWYLEP